MSHTARPASQWLSPPRAAPAAGARLDRLRGWEDVWHQFKRNRFGPLGLAIIALFAVMAVSHPILMATVWDRKTYHPLVGFDYDLAPHPTGVSARHLLGTDALGRDVLSQLLYAAGPSFGLGLLAGTVAVTLASTVGILSAYFGGLTDTLLMGLTDAFILMPPPVVLLVVGLVVDMHWPQLALVYGLFAGLGGPAVVLRSHALSIRVKPYVEAARVAGGGSWHIIRTHLLPNMLPLMILNLLFTVTGSVLTEALLSFFGRTRIRLSWGTMIWFAQTTFHLSRVGEQWHAVLAPTVAIMLFCGAFYLVGRALDEALNPRLRDR